MNNLWKSEKITGSKRKSKEHEQRVEEQQEPHRKAREHKIKSKGLQ